jgi:hypothetical protein
MTTGLTTSFAPTITIGIGVIGVESVASDGTSLYIGGIFDAVDGDPRNNIAKLNIATGILDPTFNPNLNDRVLSLLIEDTVLYIGGIFTSIDGGTTRNGLAAVDITTDITTSFDPNITLTGGTVNINSLLFVNPILYVAGYFDFVNGSVLRNNIAAFNSTTGTAVDTFDPNSNQPIYALARYEDTLYIGGGFTAINGGNDSFYTSMTIPLPEPEAEDEGAIMSTTSVTGISGTVRQVFIKFRNQFPTMSFIDMMIRFNQ